MKNSILSNPFKRVATVATAGAALALSSLPALADGDGVSAAITALSGYATAVGAGAAAVIGVSGVFALIKLGKRLLGRA